MSGGEVKDSEFSQSHAELELVRLLLEQDQVNYPQNPAALEAESYFAAADQALSLADWSEVEITQRSQDLTCHLNQLWTQASLVERFSSRIPQNLLRAIASRAQQVLAQNLSMAEQLVQCVQEVLPNWSEDDLQVFARPLAFAMRDSETDAVESTLGAVRPIQWTDLSDIEQARLSLAIARYTLDNLEQSNTTR